MVFTARALTHREWSDHLTEDVELHLDLLLDGTLVRFAPSARVEAEMPVSLEAARSQHERWERGRVELARRYVPTLVRHAVIGGPAGRTAYADAAMDQLVPPLSVVAAATVAWGAFAGVRLTILRDRGAIWDIALAAVSAATLGTHTVVALRLTGARRSAYRALLITPRMVGWKLRVWWNVVRGGRSVTWTRTARN
jgi:hypothetical protein